MRVTVDAGDLEILKVLEAEGRRQAGESRKRLALQSD